MQKTRIEWTDYTINPVKGICPVVCKTNQGKEYCYARRMYKRFIWNPRMRYDATSWLGLGSLRKPSRVFVGSTYELFHPHVQKSWLELCFEKCREFPQHTFIFLTKQPQNLAKWSPFPPNTYVGVSVTNQAQYEDALKYLEHIEAGVKFLSFEPLLNEVKLDI